MIATIGPLVQEARRQWWQSTLLFVLGSAAGGAVTFGLLGCLGQFTLGEIRPAVLWTGFAAAAYMFALQELGSIKWALPGTTRSVPKNWWEDLGPSKGALAYGIGLGLGITTVVPFASFYSLALWAVLSANAEYAVALGLAYGVARALPVLLAGVVLAPRRRVPDPRATVARIAEWGLRRGRFARRANGLADAALAGIAIAAAAVTAWK
jgi:hypothetical protein